MAMSKILNHVAGSLVAFVAFNASCARNHTGKDLRPVVIRFVSDSVPLRRTAEMTAFTVTVIIRNGSNTPIVVGGCGPQAQKEINGGWQTVWSPACVSEQISSIAPGDSLTGSVTVAGFTTGMEPRLDPRMTVGMYRLRFGPSYSNMTNPTAVSSVEALYSPPFVVF